MNSIEHLTYHEGPFAKGEKYVESYLLHLDRDKYQEADNLRFTDPEKYFETIKKLNTYTEFQMQTNIGERLNVLQSTYRYDINNEILYGENTDEPFLDMVKRGRDYRREKGNLLDRAREDAEVVGMEKIQQILCSQNCEIGTTMLSISPPGGEESIYKHNFYDVFTLKKDESGKKYIESNRYSSSLNTLDYIEKAQEFDPDFHAPQDKNEDAHFLANPILLKEKGENIAEIIHAHMHASHTYMEKDDFDTVLQITNPYIKKYIESLQKNPYDSARQGILYNAVLNIADEAAYKILKSQKEEKQNFVIQNHLSEEDIYYYGTQSVRQLDTGCGISGGYEIGANGLSGGQAAPFSVVEFAFYNRTEKKWSYHKGNCRLCKEKNIQVGPCKICKKCEKKFN